MVSEMGEMDWSRVPGSQSQTPFIRHDYRKPHDAAKRDRLRHPKGRRDDVSPVPTCCPISTLDEACDRFCGGFMQWKAMIHPFLHTKRRHLQAREKKKNRGLEIPNSQPQPRPYPFRPYSCRSSTRKTGRSGPRPNLRHPASVET